MSLARSIALAVCGLVVMAGCALESGPTLPRNPSLDGLDSVKDSNRDAIAWAPLADPEQVVVEGSVPSSRAWSTSKVLVVAAYLDRVVDGDPANIPAEDRRLIRAALARSDDAAIIALRHRVPNCAAAMASILRSVGDTTTKVPEAFEGTMEWDVREQVRFMAAIGNGELVSPEASRFLLEQMQPVASQRWGLGMIGARAFKPGWMDVRSESRQMGVVGDFAAALITSGPDPNNPSDATHSGQLNRLALLLAKRIQDDRCLRATILGWDARLCRR